MSSKVRDQSEKVRRFILEHLDRHGSDITARTAAKFAISRQAVAKHLARLREQGLVVMEGTTRVPHYRLACLSSQAFCYAVDATLAEDLVWSRDIKPALGELADNVLNLWHHGFTEMFNNAIDHAGGRTIRVGLEKTAISVSLVVQDDGIGIFRKIQGELDLLDERHALFELSKGKLTTDPSNHSGEGIFFTSRMFDKFDILSGGVYFNHNLTRTDDWLLERKTPEPGTAVFMELQSHTTRTTKKVFDEFSSGEDYGFTKTIVPVELAKYGADELVSRSQAKRVLARVHLFEKVVFDFRGVTLIGQAFADQIFRVFANEHPAIEMMFINAKQDIKEMILRAQGKKDRGSL